MSDRTVQRYQNLAVRTLSINSLYGFPYREKTVGGRTYAFWHQDDVRCVKFTHLKRVRKGRVSSLQGRWPLEDHVGCGDFFVTEIGATEVEEDQPSTCRPVLVRGHTPDDSSYNVVVAIADDTSTPKPIELRSGLLSETEKTSVLAHVNDPDSGITKLVESGLFDTIKIQSDEKEQCEGFGLHLYRVNLGDQLGLLRNVPLSWK